MATCSFPLYTAVQVRDIDRVAIETHCIDSYTLMQRAGDALFNELRRRWPDCQRPAVVCGSGNNGGDGFIVGALAKQAGLEPIVLCFTPPAELAGDAGCAMQALLSIGGTVEPYSAERMQQADLIVDALLGTGLVRAVAGEMSKLIGAINRSGLPVIAADVPSGLDVNRGVPLGVSVRAHCTVTFVGRKRGLYTGTGTEYAGDVVFADLDIPAEIPQALPHGAVLLDHVSSPVLPPRVRNAHKGLYGHVLVIGGDVGMQGAVHLAAEAAARTGAGLVSVATRAAHAGLIAAARPELMCHAVETAQQLDPLLSRATVVVVGPGMGQTRWAQGMFARVLESELPLVVDADGLSLLAAEPGEYPDRIMTPHPGEAAQLLGCDVASVEADRFAAVQELVTRYGSVVVLKGAGSLVAGPGTTISVNSTGNPAMAVAGMGDVLAGVLGGCRAQVADSVDAAQIGVYLHGAAADAAASGMQRGLLAGDVIRALPEQVNR